MTALAGPAKAAFFNFESQQVHPVALSPDGTLLFVVNTPDNRLAVFEVSPAGLSLRFEVSVGLEPVSVAARSNNEVWVVNHISDTVSIIDLSTQSVIATLEVGDEPTDVVFAGTTTTRAFVCVSQEDLVRIYDPSALATAPVEVAIFGSDPQALAVSPDLATVYVAVLESGNQTTIASEVDVADHGGMPLPHPAGQPETALILERDNGNWIDPKGSIYNDTHPYVLPDHDVAVLNADAPTLVPSYFDQLGTLNFNIGVHPISNKVFVANTEALNHIRHEPNLRGQFLRTRISIVDPMNPTLPSIVDLNAHIDYSTTPGPQSEIDMSLSQPGGMAFHSQEGTVYMTALGSGKVAVLDDNGSVIDRIEVGDGPSGLALDEANERLYVLCRFTNTLDIVNTTNRTVSSSIAMFDPSPPTIKTGRKFLYDGRISSGHGDMACSSCHAGSNFDNLAWDLGDPDGTDQPSPPGQLDPLLSGFPAMKGPMTTQTLRGLAGLQPFHWRGDREDFEDFNPAFVSLMGRDTQLSLSDMQAFKDFIMTVQFPPNPNQLLDRSFPNAPGGQPSAVRGAFDFENATLDGVDCATCHALPSGSNGQIFNGMILMSSQDIKVPQLRNMYEKTGFNMNAGDKKRGFGFIHDGSTPTLFEFLEFPAFSFTDDAQRRDMEAFLMAFDTGTAPAVGTQRTVDINNQGAAATANWLTTMQGQFMASNAGFVAKGREQGLARGWVYLGGGQWRSDRETDPLTTTNALLALAANGSEITFMGTPFGCGERIGIDRDEDTFPDRTEIEAGSDPADPASIPPDPTNVGPLAVGGNSMHLSSFPNPASSANGTTISFELAARQHIRLRIYDAKGRYVVSLHDGEMAAGRVRLPWNGQDHRGLRVASGKYFYRLQAGRDTHTRAVLLIH